MKIDEHSIDVMIDFVKTEKLASNSSKWLWAMGNLVAGDHQLHSLKEARQLVKHYLYYTPNEERSDLRTEKILALFTELSTLPRVGKEGSYTSGIKREWIERLRKAKTALPKEPEIKRQGDDYPFNLVDPAKLPTVTGKLLFQLVGDEFGLNSNYEGSTHEAMLRYLLTYLKERGYKSPLVDQIEKAYEIAASPDMASRLQRGVKEAFAGQKPLLIPGGWAGIPSGHAVYYELIPEGPEKATLRFYNTGEGIQDHERFQVGVKEKVQVMEWHGIDRQKLEDPNFALIVEEMNNTPHLPGNVNVRTEYSQRDIYVALKEFLQVSKESTSSGTLKQTQRAGTCAFRSLLAVLKNNLAPEEYRRLKCDLQLQGLISHVVSPPEPEKGPIDLNKSVAESGKWRLVKKGLQTMARKIHRQYEKGVVDSRYLMQAEAALQPVVKWVEDNKERAIAPKEGFSPFTFKPMKYGTRLQKYMTTITQEKEEKGESAPIAEAGCSHLFGQVKEIGLQNPATFGAEIKKLKSLMEQAIKNREYHSLLYSTIEFAKKIKIDEEFWKSIGDSETIIQDLNSLSQFFFISCYHTAKPDCVFPEHLYAVMKLLHAQNCMAIKLHPDISLEMHDFHDLDGHLQFFDPLIKSEFEWMKKHYCAAHPMPNFVDGKLTMIPAQSKLFTASMAIDSYDKKNVFEMRNRPDQLMDLIKKHYPEVIDKVAMSNFEYKSATKEKQEMLLYMSPHLPEWLKSLRDTRLRLGHLMNAHIVPPSGGDATFKFSFYQDAVRIGLSGIDSNALRGVPDKRNFENNLRSMSCDFMKKLQALVFNKLDTYGPLSWEKGLIAAKMPDLIGGAWSAEKVKELLHPFVNSKARILEFVEYFTRYPERLRDPDYQQILQIALFSYLENAAETQKPETAALLMEMINKQIKTAVGQNEVSTAVFLIRMNRCLSHFPQYAALKVDGVPLLKGLLENYGLPAEERSLLYAELLAHFSEMETLKGDELEALLAGSIWINDNPLPKKWDDPRYGFEGKMAVETHSQAIVARLTPQAIKRIYKQVKGKESEGKWSAAFVPGETPRYISTLDEVYTPLTGRLFALHHEVPLPAEILELSDFKLLFPDQKRGEALPGDVYRFQDHGCEILVQKKYGGLLCERKIEGKSYLFYPSRELSGYFGSRYLTDHFFAWRSLEDQQFVFEENGEVKYKAELEESKSMFSFGLELKSVVRLSDNAQLGSGNGQFRDFEESSYVQEWYDATGQLIEVELPRFGLAFTKDLACVQHEGFFLAKNQSVAALGSCRYYLTLENMKGERKIILPDQELESPEVKEVLEPRIARKMEGAHFGYTLIDHDLKSNSREVMFHLIETLAAHQEYEQAAALLKKHGEKLSSYTKKEAKILKRISELAKTTGDQSGEQTAIALYAAYLLKSASIPDLYEAYLDRYRHITHLVLSREIELSILKTFTSPERPALMARLRELDPGYQVQPSKTKQEKPKKETLDLKKALSGIYAYDHGTKSVPLITRPEHAIRESLQEYVTQALQGTEEQKQWLRTAAIFLRHSESVENRALGYLFKEIDTHPERFRVRKERENLDKWWVETKESFQGENLEVIPPAVHAAKESTPPYYRLGIQSAAEQPLPSIVPAEVAPLWRSLEMIQDALEKRKGTQNPELAGWLSAQKAQCPALEDPLQNAEWTRLVDDFDYFQTKKTAGLSLKAGSRLPVDKIEETLKEQTEATAKAMRELEKKLLELANRPPKNPLMKVLHQLALWGGLRRKVTLDDIFIGLARRDASIVTVCNPGLDAEEVIHLYTEASTYLQQAVKLQQCERCQETLGKLQKSAKESERVEYEKKLAMEFLAQREYNLAQHPLYLVFEYYSGYLLRQDQVEKLDDFMAGKTVNPVMEMIMGSGKSKVLLPLLGIMRADGKALSLLIVPQALFESISSDTQKILLSLHKHLRTLHFDRNSTFTKRSLEEIRDTLKDIIAHKQCLVMTSKSLQSLLLKFIEQANRSFEDEEYLTDEILLMQEIVNLLGEAGCPLIDEADTVLNVLHEVSFSMGKKGNPKNSEIRLIGEIYNLLYTDPKLKAIARLESDPNPDLTAPVLNEASYYKTLQRPLAEACLERLKSGTLYKDRRDAEVQNYLTNLKEEERTLLLDYLCRVKSRAKEAHRYYATLSEPLQEVFSLLGEEVSHLLPHTLTRIANQNYGLDGDVLAIPYKASKTPNSGSLYSNPYITMNYTNQIHFSDGIQPKTAEQQVRKLQRRALLEIDDSGGTLLLSETEAWKAFCELKGDLVLPLFNYNDQQIADLTAHINSSSEIKRKVIAEVFLPSMEIFEKKISCNTLAFAAFFDRLSGFTGTLWNAFSMHRKLNPMPEKGTDAKTLHLLWSLGQENAQVIKKGAFEAMLEQLDDFDMISDAGGYFKEGDNLAMARKMALKLKKPVVFYDQKGEQTITDGEHELPLSASQVKEGERLTFLDQSHTTGADVPQRLEAVGIVTIGRNMLLRDLLQSVWRLRGLEKGQKVKFIMDEDVESIIRHTLKIEGNITFAHILKFVIVNQAKQQGIDNFKAYKNQIWNLPQGLMLKSLMRSDLSPKRRKKVFELLKETWIKDAQGSARALYGAPAMERPSSEVIEEEKVKCRTLLTTLKERLPFLQSEIAEVEKEIEPLAARTLKRVHRQIISPIADDAETVEIEQEAETSVQMDVEMDTQSASEDEEMKLASHEGRFIIEVEDLTPKIFNARDNMELPLFPLEKQMEREAELSEFAPYFKDIRISLNVLAWRKGEKDYKKARLLGAYRTPFHNLIVEGDKVQLLSATGYDKELPVNYNLFLGFLDRKKELTQAAFEKIVKIKFLNGESTFNKRELEFLKQWITEAGRDKMLKLLGIIYSNRPDRAAAFAGSPLHKLMAQII